ncbi:LysE family translocator [Planktotalea sp.]|uniref:LysE family translocator n=1 Tax=Planktotalea sp. TaxID=2029877 RepID=UPI0032993068
MTGWELAALLLAWALGGGSPGPATLTISGTAMERGRLAGIVSGVGITAGSAVWGLASALGMGAVMLANVWLFTALKVIGALYLGYLAYKSFKSAWNNKPLQDQNALKGGLGRVFAKSLAIHLTNPKAILGWGAIFAIALPTDAPLSSVFVLYAQLLCVSTTVFVGYGILFSSPWIVAGYRRARRAFELGFGLLFGAASLKILTTRAV